MKALIVAALVLMPTVGSAERYCSKTQFDTQAYINYLICLHNQQNDLINELYGEISLLKSSVDGAYGQELLAMDQREFYEQELRLQIQLFSDQHERMGDLENAMFGLLARITRLEQN